MTHFVSSVFLVLAVALLSWLVVSPFLVIWWFFRPEDRETFARRTTHSATGAYVGAFISLCIVLFQGFEELLVFVPNNWGSLNEDGDFVSTRTSIAIYFGIALSLFLAYIFEKAEALRNTLDKLRHTEDELKAAKDAAFHAERQAESLEGRILAIMIRLEDLGVKEKYDELEEAEAAEDDAWIERQLALLGEQEEMVEKAAPTIRR